jgi:hypothetical protein
MQRWAQGRLLFGFVRNVRASDRFAMKTISCADVAWHILTLAEDPAPGRSRTRASPPAPAVNPAAGTENPAAT